MAGLYSTSGIYAIRHVVSGRQYIGSSKQIGKRWNEHRRALLARRHHSDYLQRAWDKYGADAFEFVVLMECAPADLIHHEQAMIDQWRSAEKAHGFNPKAVAGPSGFVSAETRKKISMANSGNRATPETRQKLSALARDRGPIHRAKIAAAIRHIWAAMAPNERTRLWERRRELYGPSGRKPKSQEHVSA